jgi:hypothetical protein
MLNRTIVRACQAWWQILLVDARLRGFAQRYGSWIALKATIESVAFGTTEYAEITEGSS